METNDIDQVADELLTKFMKISHKGWIESSRKHNTGIGKTFEDLLDKIEDNEADPDYKGIEIKTHRNSSQSYTTLFTASPDGPAKAENTRLREKYGHVDIESGLNILHSSIFSNRKTTYNKKYKFQLEVNRNDRKIYLMIFDLNDKLLEKITYWDFDSLNSKLKRKLKMLAYITSKNKIENNTEYFLYQECKLYKFKSFDKFLDLLEQGVIMLDIRIGVYKSGKSFGKTHDHGTGFRIKECDIDKLYDEYIITSSEQKKED